MDKERCHIAHAGTLDDSTLIRSTGRLKGSGLCVGIPSESILGQNLTVNGHALGLCIRILIRVLLLADTLGLRDGVVFNSSVLPIDIVDKA